MNNFEMEDMDIDINLDLSEIVKEVKPELEDVNITENGTYKSEDYYGYDTVNVNVKGGSSDYTELDNKPQINGVELSGNKSLEDLGIDQNFVKDNSYVHTDNNYTTEEKQKLENLENYNDEEIKENIGDIENELVNINFEKADRVEIPDVSEFITKDVDNLTNYTKTNDLPQIPTNVSAFTNDIGYLTEHQSLTNYATKGYVDDKIGDINTILATLTTPTSGGGE